jgi:signal transduction histidine kinase
MDDDLRFLLDASARLSESLSYSDILEQVASLLVPARADVCVVSLVRPDRRIEPILVRHVEPAKAGLFDEYFQRFPIHAHDQGGFARVVGSGASQHLRDVTDEYLRGVATSADQLECLKGLGMQSVTSVPLRTRREVIGALALVMTRSGRRFEARDVPFAEDLARRAAAAIDNARLYAEAQRALTARDEILGVVAHDLRSPLNAIKLSATLLARKVETPVTRDAAESILLSTERANRLIQDLLDVSRSEAGAFTIAPSPQPIIRLTDRAVHSQQAFAAAAGIELRTEPATAPATVVADADRVLQVFENLIGNAIKFTGAGGTVMVGHAPDDDGVRLWVRDTGHGILPEHLPHLFDRFWQGRPSDRRGAGLGLLICRAIVEAHGGRIWAESRPGSGSSFFFTLPSA